MKFKWTVRLSIVTPLLITIAFAFFAREHGYLQPAVILFPFAMFAAAFATSFPALFWILGLIQYPFYGLLRDRCGERGNWLFVLAAIVVLHLSAALYLLISHRNMWR